MSDAHPLRKPTAERMADDVESHSEEVAQPQVQMPRPSDFAREESDVQAQAPAATEAGAPTEVGVHRVHMTFARLDVLSTLKIGFLLSVAFAVMTVFAMIFIWLVLDAMHVFSEIHGLLETLGSKQLLELAQYLEFGRWVSFGVIVGIFNIFIITALSAIGAAVYNLVAALVGGQKVVVTDE